MVRIAAAVLLALAACGSPELDAIDATDLASDALDAAGLDATVRGPAAPTAEGSWVVPFEVAGAVLDLTVDTDRVVEVVEPSGRVLSDAEARAVAAHRGDVSRSATGRVVALVLLAGALAAAYLLLRRAARADRAARQGPLVGRLRFQGQICGIGTTAGHRFVVGRWESSPLGPFADVMHEAPDGTRRLLAPDQAVAELIATTYEFDEVVVADCAASYRDGRLRITATGVDVDIETGRRSALGWLLRLVPRPIATATWWCRAIGPIARRVLPGVRTYGSAGGGRHEWYGATDHRPATAVRAVLDGVDLGELDDLWPPVRFGFGSAPRRPSLVEVVTTVDVPVPPDR